MSVIPLFVSVHRDSRGPKRVPGQQTSWGLHMVKRVLLGYLALNVLRCQLKDLKPLKLNCYKNFPKHWSRNCPVIFFLIDLGM